MWYYSAFLIFTAASRERCYDSYEGGTEDLEQKKLHVNLGGN